MRGHVLLRESLNLLIFQQTNFHPNDVEKHKIEILQDFKSYDKCTLKRTHDELVEHLADKISSAYDEIPTSSSDMAKFWLSYCYMIDILMMNVYALHTRNCLEFLSSMYEMLPWLIIYDNDKYGKILPDHWAVLSTLPDEVNELCLLILLNQ